MLQKSVNFSVGVGVGAYSALKMDDLIYSQLRRHMIIPIQVLTNTAQISQTELNELGLGTKNMMRTLAPAGLNRVSAKTLLIDDKDYSTPQDHYFSYINMRQTQTPV